MALLDSQRHRKIASALQGQLAADTGTGSGGGPGSGVGSTMLAPATLDALRHGRGSAQEQGCAVIVQLAIAHASGFENTHSALPSAQLSNLCCLPLHLKLRRPE